MKNRSELREIIIKVIYQVFLLEEAKLSYDINDLIKEQIEVQNDFINNTIPEILSHKKEIFDIANKNLNKWTMSRLNKVDQAIISLGIYELMYTKTPPIVVINECVNLAKTYSDDKVKNMINAALDKVYHNLVEHE